MAPNTRILLASPLAAWPVPASVHLAPAQDANKAPLRADFRNLVDIEGDYSVTCLATVSRDLHFRLT